MWILIVLYMSGGRPSIAMQEFDGQAACEAAAAKVSALEMRGLPQIKTVCTPKHLP